MQLLAPIHMTDPYLLTILVISVIVALKLSVVALLFGVKAMATVSSIKIKLDTLIASIGTIQPAAATAADLADIEAKVDTAQAAVTAVLTPPTP